MQVRVMGIPARSHFESAYAGQPPPWEIGGPQPLFVQNADRVIGTVLDAGCGTGENALFFASRGHSVTGIDFLPRPIELARQKAAARGLAANFLVMDALALSELPQVFDTAIDSGLFHVFNDQDRRRYVASWPRFSSRAVICSCCAFRTPNQATRGHDG